MLSSSDCESRTIGALLELEPDAHGRLLETWCGYTESPGGPGLRHAIASLYERAGAEQVVATSCAEEGIFLLYHAVLRPGDHVIVETPCYESALQVARSTGAEVSQWRRRYEDGWAHDLDALAGLIRPATRLLYLNQPHNPTGTLMARPVFEHVIGLARAHGLVVFSDEVYRELEHDPASRLPAACDEYERAVSLGSISKSYGLPGLRTGVTCRSWTASSSGTPEPSRGPVRRQARSASLASPGSLTSPGTANSSPRPVSCSFRARSTTSRTISASASAGSTCPMPSKSWRPTSPTASTALAASARKQTQAARTATPARPASIHGRPRSAWSPNLGVF